MPKNIFKPIMVSFNEDEYNTALKYAEIKLKALDEASVWIHKTLDLDNINLRKFSKNMLEYFYDALLLKYSKENTLGLSAEKLCFVKEIDIKPLQELQHKYENVNTKVYGEIPKVEFKNNEATIKVNRKPYEKWTETEEQNKRIIACNSFIKEVNAIGKHCKVFPFSITQATSGLIRYDMRKQKYYVAPEEVRRNL